MCGTSSGDVPSAFAAGSCIADQRTNTLRTARDCHRRATAAAPSKRLAGRYVPECRLRRAGNPGPDGRRALPHTAALIQAGLAWIAGLLTSKRHARGQSPATPTSLKPLPDAVLKSKRFSRQRTRSDGTAQAPRRSGPSRVSATRLNGICLRPGPLRDFVRQNDRVRHLGYTRVSTSSQDAQLQLDALVATGVQKRDVFADVTSGSRAAVERPG
jgi:hypothetical protein